MLKWGGAADTNSALLLLLKRLNNNFVSSPHVVSLRMLEGGCHPPCFEGGKTGHRGRNRQRYCLERLSKRRQGHRRWLADSCTRPSFFLFITSLTDNFRGHSFQFRSPSYVVVVSFLASFLCTGTSNRPQFRSFNIMLTGLRTHARVEYHISE